MFMSYFIQTLTPAITVCESLDLYRLLRGKVLKHLQKVQLQMRTHLLYINLKKTLNINMLNKKRLKAKQNPS